MAPADDLPAPLPPGRRAAPPGDAPEPVVPVVPARRPLPVPVAPEPAAPRAGGASDRPPADGASDGAAGEAPAGAAPSDDDDDTSRLAADDRPAAAAPAPVFDATAGAASADEDSAVATTGGATGAGTEPVAAADLPVRVVDLDWRSVAVVLAAFVALVGATALIGSAPRTMAALGVATILALGLNPLVEDLRRRFRIGRAPAVAAVLAAAAAVVTVLGLLLVPPAIRQARDLGAELPTVVAELADLPVIGDDLEEAGVPERVERTIRDLPERLAGDTTPLENAARSAADTLLAALVTGLFAVTLLVDGERLLRGARRLVPVRARPKADRAASLAYAAVGKYVAGSLLVAGVAGVAVLVAGLVLGVPLTPLAAAWVMVWDLVPQIGGAAGGIPFVLLGLTQGVGTGLACAAFFVVYLQIENNVLGPLLVGQAVKLSPPATMTAALVGVSAGGVVGALLAVPLVGAAKAVYLELRPGRQPAPSRRYGAAT